uniref:Integrase core domain containing protein n=1 Tax=Solanum tuberosum TaxID=4113 RepID=M1DLE2_SOLTU
MGQAGRQPPLTATLVHGFSVDISETTLHRWRACRVGQHSSLVIKKATLTFVAKFFWLLVRNHGPSPTTDVTTLQKDIESLHVDITGLFSPPETELESIPMAPIDETVMSALFGDGMPPPVSSHTIGKRPRSSRASDETEAGRSSKKEHHQTEAAQKASILTRSCDSSGRAREISISASNSVNTTNAAVRVDDSTTEGSRMIDAGTIDGDPSV